MLWFEIFLCRSLVFVHLECNTFVVTFWTAWTWRRKQTLWRELLWVRTVLVKRSCECKFVELMIIIVCIITWHYNVAIGSLVNCSWWLLSIILTNFVRKRRRSCDILQWLVLTTPYHGVFHRSSTCMFHMTLSSLHVSDILLWIFFSQKRVFCVSVKRLCLWSLFV